MRFLLPAVVALLLLASTAPRAHAGTSHRDRVTAARAFAGQTVQFARRLQRADRHAHVVLSRRRRAAQSCVDAWGAAPLTRRSDLSLIYFEYLSGALWAVDGPLFGQWVTKLNSTPAIARLGRLKKTAEGLATAFAAANAAYTAFPDPCPVVSAWRDAGFSDAARPAALAGLDRLAEQPNPLTPAALASTEALLKAYSGNGEVAANVLEFGIDEPDSRVDDRKGCDPVGVLVDPATYGSC